MAKRKYVVGSCIMKLGHGPWTVDMDNVYDEYTDAKAVCQSMMESGQVDYAAVWRKDDAEDCLTLLNRILATQPAQARATDGMRSEERKKYGPAPLLYVTNNHVTRSNMSACIGVHMITQNDRGLEIMDVSPWVARAMGKRIDPKHGGVKVGGCGLDRGAHLIMSLSRVLFDNDYMLAYRWL